MNHKIVAKCNHLSFDVLYLCKLYTGINRQNVTKLIWYTILRVMLRHYLRQIVHEQPERYQWNGGNTHDCHLIARAYHIDWTLFEPRYLILQGNGSSLQKITLFYILIRNKLLFCTEMFWRIERITKLG